MVSDPVDTIVSTAMRLATDDLRSRGFLVDDYTKQSLRTAINDLLAAGQSDPKQLAIYAAFRVASSK